MNKSKKKLKKKKSKKKRKYSFLMRKDVTKQSNKKFNTNFRLNVNNKKKTLKKQKKILRKQKKILRKQLGGRDDSIKIFPNEIKITHFTGPKGGFANIALQSSYDLIGYRTYIVYDGSQELRHSINKHLPGCKMLFDIPTTGYYDILTRNKFTVNDVNQPIPIFKYRELAKITCRKSSSGVLVMKAIDFQSKPSTINENIQNYLVARENYITDKFTISRQQDVQLNYPLKLSSYKYDAFHVCLNSADSLKELIDKPITQFKDWLNVIERPKLDKREKQIKKFAKLEYKEYNKKKN